jgi:hypothetical protein
MPHEPDTSDEDGHHPPPIQVEDNSDAILLVPQGGCYAAVMDEVGGNSDELQLTEKLKVLHLELKNKEMELQARVQEKKQKSELLPVLKNWKTK